MLAHLPCLVPILPTDNLQDPEWQDKPMLQQLKISDAFAQLAVSEYDIVAVSTVRDWGLRVVAALNQDVTNTQAESKSLLNNICQAWKFFVTRNNRSSDPATHSGEYPTIIPSQELLDLNSQTAHEYMTDLEALW